MGDTLIDIAHHTVRRPNPYKLYVIRPGKEVFLCYIPTPTYRPEWHPLLIGFHTEEITRIPPQATAHHIPFPDRITCICKVRQVPVCEKPMHIRDLWYPAYPLGSQGIA